MSLETLRDEIAQVESKQGDLQSCLTSLFSVIERICTYKSTLWFRGQAVTYPTIEPGVFRKNKERTHYLNPDESSMNLLFRAKAGTRHARCPDREDLVGWLFLEQHFRLPTRILDWSESLLVALFFAAGGYRDDSKIHRGKDGVLYILDPLKLNKEMLGGRRAAFKGNKLTQYAKRFPRQADFGGLYPNPEQDSNSGRILFPDHPEVIHLSRVAFNPLESLSSRPNRPPREPVDEHRQVFAVMAEAIDTRQAVQQGVFTIHGGPEVLKIDKDSENYLLNWRLCSDLKDAALDTLKRMGISNSVVFPDLDNLSGDVAAAGPVNGGKPSD